VHGGQQPVIGAHIYLLAANTTGYGQASVSLLTAAVLATSPLHSGVDTSGNYYVISDNTGSFSITGDYSCTPNTRYTCTRPAATPARASTAPRA